MSPSEEKIASVENTRVDKSAMTTYVRQSLDKVAAAEGFNKYKIDFNSSSNVGDGFSGKIFKAVIIEIESDKKLGVIVKIPPENCDTRVRFGIMEMFEREVIAYNKVLPEFSRVQEEKEVPLGKRFTHFPKCYFAEFDKEKHESIIIMEDLREKNFFLSNKVVATSFEQAKLVFTALGRFHAISFAMKSQKPEIFDEYKNLKDYLLKRLHRKDQQTWLPGKIDRASETIDKNDSDSVDRVKKLKLDIEQILIDLTDAELAEPYAVLGHGDCWYNNFMYKFEVKL